MASLIPAVVFLFLLLWPSVASAQSDAATHLAIGSYLTAAFGDTSITSYAIGRGGFHEANPLLRPLVEKHGVATAMLVKGAMHTGIAGLLLRGHAEHPKRAFWISVGLTAAQVAVDVKNARTTRAIR